MNRYQCPVCEGWESTSNSGSLGNHIKRKGAYELLHQYLFGEQVQIPHAIWLKKHAKTVIKTEIQFSLKKD